ncbi:MAG TPA: nucleoside-diphosphate kinase [bacterium]|nr:nucleoside-diphosphate kinase [bacterium]
MERSLVLLKPDAIHRGLIGDILARMERRGIKIVGLKMITLGNDLIADHYSHLASKPFFPEIVAYMTAGPIVALVAEAEGVVSLLRTMCGPTNSADALPGTIRGDYATTIRYNIIHASDSIETAEVEIKRFFAANELSDYGRIVLEG